MYIVQFLTANFCSRRPRNSFGVMCQNVCYFLKCFVSCNFLENFLDKLNDNFGSNFYDNFVHKVDIFWEGHKILRNLHRRFVLCSTAKRKLERLQFSTSLSCVKIWSACSCEFKAYFWTFWALYHLLFDLETIGVN